AAAVGAEDHALRIIGIHPQVVVVPDRLDRAEGLAAVVRPVEPQVRQVDAVGVLGIGGDPGVVPGPLADVMIVVDPGPRVAAILAAVEPALLRLDDRVHAPRACARAGHADAAERPLGHALLKLLPGVAAIERAP